MYSEVCLDANACFDFNPSLQNFSPCVHQDILYYSQAEQKLQSPKFTRRRIGKCVNFLGTRRLVDIETKTVTNIPIFFHRALLPHARMEIFLEPAAVTFHQISMFSKLEGLGCGQYSQTTLYSTSQEPKVRCAHFYSWAKEPSRYPVPKPNLW